MARINATRTELLKTRRRIRLAKRGHKLLKDKRDRLMLEFLQLIQRTGNLRERVNRKLGIAFNSLVIARSKMHDNDLEMLLSEPEEPLKLNVSTRSVMSVAIPVFGMKREDVVAVGFSMYGIPSDVEVVRLQFRDVLHDLIALAQLEKSIKALAREIEKTRRRVNVLEHYLIPRFEGTARTIKMKLDEEERGNFVKLLKVKSEIGG